MPNDNYHKEEIHIRVKRRHDSFIKMVNNVPGAVFQRTISADGTWKYPFMSAGVKDLYGISAQCFLEDGSVTRAVTHPDDWEWFAELVARAGRELTPVMTEFRILRPNGEIRWLRHRSSPRPGPDGGMVWDCYESDITARRDAEVALEENTIQLRTILDSALDAIIAADEDGRIVLFNKCAESIFQYSENELLNRNVSVLMTPEDAGARR